jgi:hypothetical protein
MSNEEHEVTSNIEEVMEMVRALNSMNTSSTHTINVVRADAGEKKDKTIKQLKKELEEECESENVRIVGYKVVVQLALLSDVGRVFQGRPLEHTIRLEDKDE